MLWWLFAVSVPLIIHLFNFRKFRKVYFTNVRFLEELKQQTRKQSKLRHLLVMFSRMLAIASLVFAFAQPVIREDKSVSRPDAVKQVNIYIDNSFSMEALSTAGLLLESAKLKAREITAAYRSTDLFRLTTNDFEGRHQRWVNQEEFLQMIDEIAVSPEVRTMSEVLDRQNESYFDAPGQSKIGYLVSDFQLRMADFGAVTTDSLMAVHLVPMEAVKTENLFIDSCWFVSPVHQLDQGVRLLVRIVNDSEVNFEKVPLKLSVSGKQKAMASFDVRPGTFIDVELPFTNYEAGIQAATVEITDYPVVFDDRMFLVYNVAGSIPVLAINGKEASPYLNSLYGSDSAFRFVNNQLSNIDYNRLQEYELVILNELDELSSGLMQELTTYLGNGGTLLVIPSSGIDFPDYQQFLASVGSNYYTEKIAEQTRVSEIDEQNPVFEEVFERSKEGGRDKGNTDLPSVREYYSISDLSQSSQVPIMTLINGKPFLSRESAGQGQVYLLASPLGEDYSNFARHALFVPALFRIALLSAASDPLYYTIGRDSRIELSQASVTGDNVLKIASDFEDFEFIPGMQNLDKKINLFIFNQVRKAGHYKLMKNNEAIKGLGFNYNRRESVMKFAGKTELEEQIGRYSLSSFRVIEDKGKPLSDTIKDMNQGTTLWKLFIILALVFLAIEVVLLRFWRSVK